jgi:hypothetical protein
MTRGPEKTGDPAPAYGLHTRRSMPFLPSVRRAGGALALALACTGCSAGLSARTVAMRRALDDGSPTRALEAVNRELRVKRGDELPDRLADDDALLVLDRATIHHSLGELADAKRDYETADKALDVLDLSHGTAEEIGRWVYSDARGATSRRRTRSCS